MLIACASACVIRFVHVIEPSTLYCLKNDPTALGSASFNQDSEEDASFYGQHYIKFDLFNLISRRHVIGLTTQNWSEHAHACLNV